MERLMTGKTLSILNSLQAELDRQIAEMGSQSDGGHARSSYHDDAGFELLKNQTLAERVMVGDLAEAKIIIPRIETDVVGIGNKIKIRFVEEDSEETVYLLGQDDVVRRKDLNGIIVSTLSPLGISINGRSKDETVEVKVGKSDKIHVNILDIEPGDF
jgi:transcription elongation GreA/GreB family factor